MATLLILPDSVLLDLLPPLLTNYDLCTLRLLNHQSHTLFSDEILWKRRVIRDFTFPSHASARVGGWFRLYAGLSSPSVYVWGESSNGRMPFPSSSDILTPTSITLPDRPIEMVAGGWSFHLRTCSGKVMYWGTMNGDGFGGPWSSLGDPCKLVDTPGILDVPPVKALAGGRAHAVALTEGCVLEWKSWGTIWLLENVGNVKQLEAGWDYTVTLTTEDQVLLWYSDWSSKSYQKTYDQEASFHSTDPIPIPVEPIKLPNLKGIKRIAAGESFLLALTSCSQIYSLDLTLPHPPPHLFFSPDGTRRSMQDVQRLQLVQSPLTWVHRAEFSRHNPTHISAHFCHFVAYSQEEVLIGQWGEETPIVIDELQGRGIIKVVMGDYHFGALTREGEVLTWGKWSRGALGLGEGNMKRTVGGFAPVSRAQQQSNVPDKVDKPTKLATFGGKKFAFDIAFAGWHSSALAMDVA